jgi:hypothetical protein
VGNPHTPVSTLMWTAMQIGTVLGVAARHLDQLRGHRPRPEFLEHVLQETQERAKEEPHAPQDGRIATLGEVAHLR